MGVANLPSPGLATLLCVARQIVSDGPTPLGLRLQDLGHIASSCHDVKAELTPVLGALKSSTPHREVADLLRMLGGSHEPGGTGSSALKDRVLRSSWSGARLDLICQKLRTLTSADANMDAARASSVSALEAKFRASLGIAAGAAICTSALATLPERDKARVIEALAERSAAWADIFAENHPDPNVDAARYRAMTALCGVMTQLIASVPQGARSPLLNALWLLGSDRLIGTFRVVNGELDANTRFLLPVQLARWCVEMPGETAALLDRHPPLDAQQRIVFAATLRQRLHARDGMEVKSAESLRPFGITAAEYKRSLRWQAPRHAHAGDETVPWFRRSPPGWTTLAVAAPSGARANIVALALLNDPTMISARARDALFAQHSLNPDERLQMAVKIMVDAYARGQHPDPVQIQHRYGLSKAEQHGALQFRIVQDAARHHGLRFTCHPNGMLYPVATTWRRTSSYEDTDSPLAGLRGVAVTLNRPQRTAPERRIVIPRFEAARHSPAP